MVEGVASVAVTSERKGSAWPGPVRVTADFWEMVLSLLARQVFTARDLTTGSQSVPDCSFVQLAVLGERLRD